MRFCIKISFNDILHVYLFNYLVMFLLKYNHFICIYSHIVVSASEYILTKIYILNKCIIILIIIMFVQHSDLKEIVVHR